MIVPTELPWGPDEAGDAALAAGHVQPAEVLHWQQLAERATHAHGGGDLVLHRWQPVQRNGGAPVVLLHGGSGSWTHWVRSIGALLAAGHDVWAVDLPGFGASDLAPGVDDGDTMPPVLADALQAVLPMQAVQLVGFSFGGMTATLLAAAYPHLVQHLVVVGAPGTGLRGSPPHRLKGWRHLPTPREQLALHVFNLGELMVANPATIDRDMVALHVANVQRDRLPRRRVAGTDIVLQALARIEVPVTAIYGSEDVLYRGGLLPQVATLMAGAARDFRGLRQVPGAGHWVQHEAPEAFMAQLLPVLHTA